MTLRFSAIPDSLRWRVQILHGLLLAVLLLALGVTAFLVMLDRYMRDVDNEIYRAAFLIDGRLRGGSSLNDQNIAEGIIPSRGALYYVIWESAGGAGERTASANAPREIPRPEQQYEGFGTREGYREAFINSAPGRYVLVGRSLEADKAYWLRLALAFAAIGLLLWSAVMLAGRVLIDRALRPLRDITEAAEQIANGDLSRRIQTRDAQTELGRLVAVLNTTFTRLEAAFTRQTRFTADAAHELRTPVAIVLAHAQNGLAAADLAVEERAAFEACQRAARRMRRLIEGLLQLARFDHGDEAAPQQCHLDQIAEEALVQLRPLAAERNVTLIGSLMPAQVSGNPDQLTQVIFNLLDNAIHCHGGSPGRVFLSTREEGEEAICEVRDDGPGIAGEHLDRLFERFYQVDKARSHTLGRCGLGLAISQAIVQAHRGVLSVESAPGQGSTFVMRLPRPASKASR